MTSPGAHPLNSMVEIPGFDITEEIGEGASSVVFRAVQTTLQRVVAIKVLKKDVVSIDSRRRFNEECALLSSIDHPNVVTVFASGLTKDERPYIVMELLDGGSLSSLLKSGPVSTELAIPLFRQILSGLSSAHSNNIVHRDIKPGNIMLAASEPGAWTAKLTDFGIATTIHEDGKAVQNLTQTGAVVGTALYMSPEQCNGGEASRASDLYAVGCVIYEALTGTPPFNGETHYEVMYKHTHEDPDLKKINDPSLRKLLTTAMCKDASKRFANANTMQEELNAVVPAAVVKSRFPHAAVALAICLTLVGIAGVAGLNRKASVPKAPTIRSVNAALKPAAQLVSQRLVREAQKMLNTSLDRYQRAPLKDRAQAHLILVRAYYFQHRRAEAYNEISKVDRLLKGKESENLVIQAEVCTWKALMERSTGNLQLAKEYANKALKIYLPRKERFAEAHVAGLYCHFAGTLRSEGAPAKALEYSKKALEARNECDALHGEPGHILDFDAFKALDQFILEDYKSARESAKLAFSKKDMETDDHISALLLLGEMFAVGSDFHSSRAVFMQCLDELKSNHADEEFLMTANSKVAFACLGENDLASARKYVSEAVQISNRVNNPEKSYTYLVAGELELACGNTKAALHYLQSAIEAPQPRLLAVYEHRLHWLLGTVLCKENQRSEGIKHLRQAFQQWRKFSPRNNDYGRMLHDYLQAAIDGGFKDDAALAQPILKEYEHIRVPDGEKSRT